MKNEKRFEGHTPGPCGVEQTATTNWIGPMRPDGNKVYGIVADTDRDSLTDESLARNDADARLIAAAPEMLETLEALKAVWMTLTQEVREKCERRVPTQNQAALVKLTDSMGGWSISFPKS